MATSRTCDIEAISRVAPSYAEQLPGVPVCSRKRSHFSPSSDGDSAKGDFPALDDMVSAGADREVLSRRAYTSRSRPEEIADECERALRTAYPHRRGSVRNRTGSFRESRPGGRDDRRTDVLSAR